MELMELQALDSLLILMLQEAHHQRPISPRLPTKQVPMVQVNSQAQKLEQVELEQHMEQLQHQPIKQVVQHQVPLTELHQELDIQQAHQEQLLKEL